VNTHTWQEVALRISQTLLVWNLKRITMTPLASRYYQLDYTCLQDLSQHYRRSILLCFFPYLWKHTLKLKVSLKIKNFMWFLDDKVVGNMPSRKYDP
jgi:hypothetical protein